MVDVNVPNGAGNYVRVLLTSLVSPRSNIWNLIKNPPILKSLPRVLNDVDVLDGTGDGVRVLIISIRSFTESFIKIKNQEPCQDSTYPPSLLLESSRTWMSLMELEMVSRYSWYPSEALLKVSLRSNIRNLIKTPHILQVYSWSLGGRGCPWWNWRWCQGTYSIHQKLYWKFDQDPTSEILYSKVLRDGTGQTMRNIFLV